MKPVEEALRAGLRPIHQIYVSREIDRGATEELSRLAGCAGVQIHEVSRDFLASRAEIRVHQGVLALCGPYPYRSVDDLMQRALRRGEDPFLLVAAHIQDPQNLGSLVRSATEAGVHGVIVPKRRAASVTPAVVKASAGATEHMGIARVTNLVRTVEDLKERRVWVYAGDAAGQSMYEANLSGAIALCVGSEESGVPRLLSETCDGSISIPSRGEVGSLNASVAGAVMMYEVVRRRLRRGDT